MNVADDVREVMWHILVGYVLCCRVGEKVNEMQCFYGIENGQGAFMALGARLVILQEAQIRGRDATWKVVGHLSW